MGDTGTYEPMQMDHSTSEPYSRSYGQSGMHLIMLAVDLVALLIYIDLYMVVRYKRHIFSFIIESKFIAQKQLKPY